MPITDSWIDQELAGCQFKNMRLGKRFRKLLEQLSDGTGESIPFACQDWANTKAAYRFLSDERVKRYDSGGAFTFHAGSLCSDGQRLSVLILHDTTEFTYSRANVEAIGILHKSFTGKMERGRPHHFTVCGILMHSSLAVSTDGLPLGLTAIKFWTRSKFKGTNALKRKINPTRVPIEEKESFRWLENLRQSTVLLGDPRRCVHIGDRESDIYELLCTAKELGTSFLVRTCVDRLAGDGSQTIAAEIKGVPVKGLHPIEVRDRNGELSEATLELKWKRIQVLPPIGKSKQYPELSLTVIYAQERTRPKSGMESIGS